MTRRLRKRLKDESGFSLIELLTAEVIGGMVLTAAIMMVILSVKQSKKVTDRVAAAQDGRTAMEQIQQRLRSQTCLFPLEYTVNGSTAGTSLSQPGVVHASSNKLIFIGDVGNSAGATGATGAVGFRPQLRWIEAVTESTGRLSRLVEGWRNATNTVTPYNFSLTPVTNFTSMAAPGTAASVTPSVQRPLAQPVTQAITGATGRLPYLSYYDAADVQITEISGAIPSAQIGAIERVSVNFRMLPGSGRQVETGTRGVDQDTRMPSFQNDIYLRTLADRCQ